MFSWLILNLSHEGFESPTAAIESTVPGTVHRDSGVSFRVSFPDSCTRASVVCSGLSRMGSVVDEGTESDCPEGSSSHAEKIPRG